MPTYNSEDKETLGMIEIALGNAEREMKDAISCLKELTNDVLYVKIGHVLEQQHDELGELYYDAQRLM